MLVFFQNAAFFISFLVFMSCSCIFSPKSPFCLSYFEWILFSITQCVSIIYCDINFCLVSLQQARKMEGELSLSSYLLKEQLPVCICLFAGIPPCPIGSIQAIWGGWVLPVWSSPAEMGCKFKWHPELQVSCASHRCELDPQSFYSCYMFKWSLF